MTAMTTDTPDLSSRTARCVCGATKPSSPTLGWFEYRGEGSKAAREHCRCGYYESAHVRDANGLNEWGRVPFNDICPNFTPHGGYEFDSYYCGCDNE